MTRSRSAAQAVSRPRQRIWRKARKRNDTGKMQVSHRHDGIDPVQSQACLLSLGGNRGGVGSEGHEGLELGLWRGLGLQRLGAGGYGPIHRGRAA